MSQLRTALNASKSGLKVDRLRKARDQKVILGCSTKQQLKHVTQRIKEIAPNLNIEEAKNKDPLVIIKDVFSFNSDEDILEALKNQNKELLNDISVEEYRVQIKYRRKARNDQANHIVLQVSPKVWTKFTSVGKIYVDMQRVTVQDQSPLVQCTRCLEYGHGKKTCQDTEDTCSHCGEKHHKTECQRWRDGETPTCRNCIQTKSEQMDHNAFDDTCPVRKKWDSIARSSVAYTSE